MAMSKVRVAGTGYTYLTYKGKRIERLRNFNDSGQSPVASAEPIQGIGDDYPTEIAFPAAIGAGQLTFTTYELWEKGMWQDIFNGRFDGTNDLLELFKSQLKLGDIQIQKVIKGPNGKGRVITYDGVVVVNATDAESVQLSTMTHPKTVTCMYTHTTASKVG